MNPDTDTLSPWLAWPLIPSRDGESIFVEQNSTILPDYDTVAITKKPTFVHTKVLAFCCWMADCIASNTLLY
jgi:hypothetical protein